MHDRRIIALCLLVILTVLWRVSKRAGLDRLFNVLCFAGVFSYATGEMNHVHPWRFVFCGVAALCGGLIGWYWPIFAGATEKESDPGTKKSGKRTKVDKLIEQFGGEDAYRGAITNFLGGEILTVWIPLDHNPTDEDWKFAQGLGDSMHHHVSKDTAYFSTVNGVNGLNRIGVVVRGHEADAMLEAIRPFFKAHCPKDSVVAREGSIEDDPSEDPNSWACIFGRTLFEDEELKSE